MIWKCNQVKAAHPTGPSALLTVVLYYKKFHLGHLSMNKVQKQTTGQQKVHKIDLSDKGLYPVQNGQRLEMHFPGKGKARETDLTHPTGIQERALSWIRVP